MLVVTVRDMPGYHALAQRLFTNDINVRNVKAFFSVKRAKFTTRVPLRVVCRCAACRRVPVRELVVCIWLAAPAERRRRLRTPVWISFARDGKIAALYVYPDSPGSLPKAVVIHTVQPR